ncbi:MULTISPECIES: ImmA/IrrE family metallo-endopeptidase [Heyndrickxia]|uniref:IrrE N-terminal-like domain-containing protein n=2 Tax=Heyndrickxia coagulans TaxID=1398 RepID=A0A0B5X7Q3_HEYCO|nr:ImmA/IrrE family metallo-endopeptidase [Heyndrickxia coagulans]AJH78989.1 hypothetical protein BF29_2566 [Heyndrickxia coagulans DSM 1 = ATCC 7050]AJH79076.1 hypothetical protein BF29_2490 [Heyndrickxia coagulans DSM 1 = ATCC 7050]AWP37810.1 ImmA/IrrE family metallo-endopeptidase [Heyndrickxia coagulans]MCR2847354.1 ImmA/IrrE family metallo-endopeptidase [Heyndrickxia coagulans]MDR4225178.1 ImmA/IrrE family metallo-endopeptidase [Heyndrickxia coagulans DSM 1 = ATCC 7050]
MRLRQFILMKKKDFYEEEAKKILKHVQFKHPSEIDLFTLCDLYGMKINHIKEPYSRSWPIKDKRRGLIELGTYKNEIVERQILAEEFSHLYLHYSNELLMNEYSLNKTELQAFKLAANLLMPVSWILKADVSQHYNNRQILADELAKEYNVTVDFALNRLNLLQETCIFNTDSDELRELQPDPIFYRIPNVKKQNLVIMANGKEQFSL